MIHRGSFVPLQFELVLEANLLRAVNLEPALLSTRKKGLIGNPSGVRRLASLFTSVRCLVHTSRPGKAPAEERFLPGVLTLIQNVNTDDGKQA
jgi:hypothetical protein